MNKPSTPHVGSGPAQIGPAVLGASSFACADVLSKVVLIDGADVLTMSAVRAVIGLAILLGWMQLVPSRAAFGRREMTLDELSKHFTGVVLELAPAAGFVPQRSRMPMSLSRLWSRLYRRSTFQSKTPLHRLRSDFQTRRGIFCRCDYGERRCH